jgi:brefeldin A-inhibited guanine nucleotide-exchange protein
MYNFKAHLKSEIEVFMANIFLRVLESPNSSYDQKALVLEALRTLCSDPVMLTQLFLNYDCDFDAVDLYKSIVWNLARVSTKHLNTPQDAALSQTGLEVLVVILKAFLKVLNLPGGKDEVDDTSSLLRSKRTINLDIALAVTSEKVVKKHDDGTETESESDDSSMHSLDVKIISDKKENSEVVAGKIVDAFDRKRAVQQNFENGIIKFTLSLKGGLHYFIENGFLKLDAREIASFLLKYQDRLDKTQIGEVLGKEPDASFLKEKSVDPEIGGEGFFVRILHHYVYALDFTGMSFDEAMRSFLSGFRLPGEAQKVSFTPMKKSDLR